MNKGYQEYFNIGTSLVGFYSHLTVISRLMST
jgi:hypothetical protein